MSCIYIIKNIFDNKVYIGKTNYFTNRKKEHLRKLKSNKHINRHIQFAYNKYGENCFLFDIIEFCDLSNIDSREKYWISYYNSTNDVYGYNLTCGGDGGITTKEIRDKQSESKKKYKKKVYAFKLNGDFYKYWDSIKECSKELLVNTCDIRRTIKQKQYSCKGLILQETELFDYRLTPSQKSNLRIRNSNGTFKSICIFN